MAGNEAAVGVECEDAWRLSIDGSSWGTNGFETENIVDQGRKRFFVLFLFD